MNEISKLHRDHDLNLSNLKNQHEDKLSKVTENYESKISELKKNHKNEVFDMNNRIKKCLDGNQRDNEEILQNNQVFDKHTILITILILALFAIIYFNMTSTRISNNYVGNTFNRSEADLSTRMSSANND